MSNSRRFELFESYVWGTKPALFFPSPLQAVEMELDEQVSFALDVLSPSHCPKPPFFEFSLQSRFLDSWASDLTSIVLPPFASALRRAETELQLRSLSDRVAALELGLERAEGARTGERDRKYKWTAEIKGPGGESDRKYRVVAEAKAGGERNVKWSTEVKGKGSYTFEASSGPSASVAGSGKEKEKKGEKKGEKKNKKGAESSAKLVEIEEQNPGAIVIRKAFAKRILVDRKGKRRELAPQDAAVIIQMSFRAYLVRRSQIVRGLRELAVAKSKLKEIRSLFNNLSYQRRIVRDLEERQRFTEKIIVLLLTVEAILGVDYMVRAAKKSIIDELEFMLEVVDPQPTGMLGSLKRRKFDLPEGVSIAREMARSVAQVVELIDEHDEAAAPRETA